MTAVLHERVAGLATTLDNSQLAALRTVMAADRTLMAWVRTSLSLQSFGFTLYKVLEGLVAGGRGMSPQAPTNAGLILCFAGVMAMLMGIAEYRYTLRMLGMHGVLKLGRLTVLLSVMISSTGVLLFVAIATRVI